MEELMIEAINLIKDSKNIVVFTGAGISVSSGIPCFTGEDGLWSKYNPIFLEIDYYMSETKKAWPAVKAIFYDKFMKAKPNKAHNILADWEKREMIKGVITQNIDSLHQLAGSKNVVEFHGSSRTFVCLSCRTVYNLQEVELSEEVPRCKKCMDILKPNFVFYGDSIPEKAYDDSMKLAKKSDLFIIIGTAGEVRPANVIPTIAKHTAGAKIIEINIEKSTYTDSITDLFLKGDATEILEEINNKL